MTKAQLITAIRGMKTSAGLSNLMFTSGVDHAGDVDVQAARAARVKELKGMGK